MSGAIPVERRVRRNPPGDKWLKRLSRANLDALQDDAADRSDLLVDMDLVQLIDQLGGALWNVSGGRLVSVGYVVYLPVSSGYVVAIELAFSDTYTVRRLLMRGGRIFGHGARERVYADELAEVAIRAGSYRSYGDDWAVKA